MGYLTAEWAAYANTRPKRLGSMAQTSADAALPSVSSSAITVLAPGPFRMPRQLCPAAMEDPWMPGTFSMAGEPPSEMGR